MRLQQFIAACGLASRRAAERLIADGRVTVNGQRAELGAQVDPAADHVAVDGQPLQPDQKIHILLNKPRGVITSAKDTRGRDTVMDCLSGLDARVFPVGRLDLDVEGTLLLTNDGDLAYRLTHPKYEIAKVYRVKVRGAMSGETADRLEKGVPLEDGMTAPCTVRIISSGPRTSEIELTLHEGRKREVKRMCAHVGHPVRELRRIAFGAVKLGTLKPGQWRKLSTAEVHALYEITGLLRERE